MIANTTGYILKTSLSAVDYAKQLKKRKNRPTLASSYAFCRSLSSASSLGEILNLSLEHCLNFLSAEAGSIFIYDKDCERLILRHVKGSHPNRALGLRVQAGEGVTGRVAMDRQGIVVEDVHREHFFSEERAHQYRTSSFVSAPISLNGHLVGVMNITERVTSAPFCQEDLDFLTLLSPHIAAAIVRVSYGCPSKQASSGNLVGKLTAGLSHEINNPLGGVLRYINLSLQHVDRKSKAGEYLVQAKRGTHRIMSVMKSLLDFSRQAQNSARSFSSVQRVIDQGLLSVREQAGEKGVWIQVDIEPNLAPVVDCGLQQVIANLAENALHVIERGGRIKIGACSAGKNVRMIVEDNGSGVDEAIAGQIFDPFFSTKPLGQGTGLGLAISKEIVERGGGTIAVESQKGIGTRFIVSVPSVPRRVYVPEGVTGA